jgi:hypothetical protein
MSSLTWGCKQQQIVFQENTLTQPGLIKQAINDVGFDGFSKGKDFPGDAILYTDHDGPPCHRQWNYHSIIGKLNDIVNNARPDISMVVHQHIVVTQE